MLGLKAWSQSRDKNFKSPVSIYEKVSVSFLSFMVSYLEILWDHPQLIWSDSVLCPLGKHHPLMPYGCLPSSHVVTCSTTNSNFLLASPHWLSIRLTAYWLQKWLLLSTVHFTMHTLGISLHCFNTTLRHKTFDLLNLIFSPLICAILELTLLWLLVFFVMLAHLHGILSHLISDLRLLLCFQVLSKI